MIKKSSIKKIWSFVLCTVIWVPQTKTNTKIFLTSYWTNYQILAPQRTLRTTMKVLYLRTRVSKKMPLSSTVLIMYRPPTHHFSLIDSQMIIVPHIKIQRFRYHSFPSTNHDYKVCLIFRTYCTYKKICNDKILFVGDMADHSLISDVFLVSLLLLLIII